MAFPDDWRAIESEADFEAWLAPLRKMHWVIRRRSTWDRRGRQDGEAMARTVD